MPGLPMWSTITAEEIPMSLTPVERERIQDSKRKIQSITHSLHHVDPRKIADFESIEDCLEVADRNLEGALRIDGAAKPEKSH
jgi:hypothetical protein